MHQSPIIRGGRISNRQSTESLDSEVKRYIEEPVTAAAVYDHNRYYSPKRFEKFIDNVKTDFKYRDESFPPLPHCHVHGTRNESPDVIIHESDSDDEQLEKREELDYEPDDRSPTPERQRGGPKSYEEKYSNESLAKKGNISFPDELIILPKFSGADHPPFTFVDL